MSESDTPLRTEADLDPVILGSIIDQLIELIAEIPETTFPQALASYYRELEVYIEAPKVRSDPTAVDRAREERDRIRQWLTEFAEMKEAVS